MRAYMLRLCINVSIHAAVCRYVCMHTCMHVCMSPCTFIRIILCMSLWMLICVSVPARAVRSKTHIRNTNQMQTYKTYARTHKHTQTQPNTRAHTHIHTIGGMAVLDEQGKLVHVGSGRRRPHMCFCVCASVRLHSHMRPEVLRPDSGRTHIPGAWAVRSFAATSSATQKSGGGADLRAPSRLMALPCLPSPPPANVFFRKTKRMNNITVFLYLLTHHHHHIFQFVKP